MKSNFKGYLIRSQELKQLLNKANHAYYVLDSPILEDNIYDSLYRELIDIERNFPELITIDSPTQRLGGKVLDRFESVMHRIPLYSLDNAFNIKEFAEWYKRINKIIKKNNCDIKTNNPKVVCELKIDGNSIALSYSNGKLTQAATRGDGK